MSFLPKCLCGLFNGDVCMMIAELFSTESGLLSSEDELKCTVEDLSYKIRQKYPDRLITYDAEACNEARLIRFSDLTPSVLEMMMADGDKAKKCCDADALKNDCDKPSCSRDIVTRKRSRSSSCDLKCCEKRSSCEDPQGSNKSLEIQNSKKRVKCASCEDRKGCETSVNCGDSKAKPAPSPSKACINICDSLKPFRTVERLTRRQLAQLDEYSRALHKMQVERSPTCMPADWDCLNSMHKFSFYWQALTGHELRATPYENFKDIFSRRYRKNFPRNSARELQTAVRYCWRRLTTEERVPYNLHALLYAVSVGAVDACDHAAVRLLLSRWK